MADPISIASANTNLFIIWGLMLSLFPTITYFFKSKKTNWGNFWVVWFFLAVISGIVLTFLTIAPEKPLELLIKLKGFIF